MAQVYHFGTIDNVKNRVQFNSAFLFIVLLFIGLGGVANAQNNNEQVGLLDQPKIIAVQTRPNILTREISGHIGYLPQDHFNTYVNFGLSYTKYFNDYLGWEIFNASYAQASSTGLEAFLLRNFQALPDASDVIKYWASTNIVYTPLFMKHLAREQNVLWGDLSFLAGYGLTKLENSGNANTIHLGAMMRYFSGKHMIYKLDLRQMIFLTSAVKPNVQIGFSIGYNFGSEDSTPRRVD